MTPKRYQISTTISAVTWYQIVRLTVDYGTKREVITRAVQLLEAHTDMPGAGTTEPHPRIRIPAPPEFQV